MDKCKHKKVYAPTLDNCFPPKRAWICRTCGEEGKDAKYPCLSGEYEWLKFRFKELNAKKNGG